MTSFFFFFNDTATTEIYTLSLHDALPICTMRKLSLNLMRLRFMALHRILRGGFVDSVKCAVRSEEHTSELQSRLHLVCRLLLEKKKNKGTCYDPSITLNRFSVNRLIGYDL